MIRYRYATHMTPPAPFVNITLVCPATGASATVSAQVDPGADRTALPGPLVTSLGLAEDGRLAFQGFAGAVVELPVYLVEVQIQNLPAVAVRAALGEVEPWVLLGRDVLNSHRVILDGPNLVLEIG